MPNTDPASSLPLAHPTSLAEPDLKAELAALRRAFEAGERRRCMSDRRVAEDERRQLEDQVAAEIIKARLPFKIEAAIAAGRETADIYDVNGLREVFRIPDESDRAPRLPHPRHLLGAARLVYAHCQESGLSPTIDMWNERDKGGIGIFIPLAETARALMRGNIPEEAHGTRWATEFGLRKLEGAAAAGVVKAWLPRTIEASVAADQRTIDVYDVDCKRELMSMSGSSRDTTPLVVPMPEHLLGGAKLVYDFCLAAALFPLMRRWSDLRSDMTGMRIVIPVPGALSR